MSHRVTLTTNGDYWQARWRDESGRPCGKSLGNRSKVTKSAARAMCIDIEAGFVMNPGTKGVHRSPTLRAWIDRYLILRKDELDEGTLRLHKLTGTYLCEYLSDGVRLDRITDVQAQDFPAWLARKEGRRGLLSKESQGLHVRNAKVLFNWARKRKLIAANPFADVSAPGSKGIRRFHYVSVADLDRLIDACPDDAWRAMFALCRRAGLRRGEAMRLTWADVDFSAGTLAIRPENDEETTKQRFRTVPMDPDLARMMVEIHERAGGEKVAPIGGNNIERKVAAIVKRAGLPKYPKPFHALRKSLETDWLQRYPVMTVCKMMGHAPSVAAEFYHQVHESEIKAITGGTDPLAEAQAEIARLKAILNEQGVSCGT